MEEVSKAAQTAEMSLSLLLWQALYEPVNRAIELLRIVDEERVSILVEPLQPNLVANIMDTNTIGGFDEPAFRSLGNDARPAQNAQE
jgi:hypothetical protein